VPPYDAAMGYARATHGTELDDHVPIHTIQDLPADESRAVLRNGVHRHRSDRALLDERQRELWGQLRRDGAPQHSSEGHGSLQCEAHMREFEAPNGVEVLELLKGVRDGGEERHVVLCQDREADFALLRLQQLNCP